MIKLLLTGIWVCAVTLGSIYGAASWKAGTKEDKKADYFDGLNYERTGVITVPMVADGAVAGYIVAEFVFTIDSNMLNRLSVPPHPFVIDEAFRAIYEDPDLDTGNLKKFDMARLTDRIAKDVNSHLQADIIVDVLVEQFNYLPPEKAKA